MKKYLTVVLAVLMAFAAVGCGKKTEENPSKGDEPVVGGYQPAEDMNMTPELIEMFEKAFENYSTDMNYSPVMLVATQVVAGTNYKFQCDGIKSTEPMKQGTYYVYINKDLNGNASVLDIEVIEEHELKRVEPLGTVDTDIKLK